MESIPDDGFIFDLKSLHSWLGELPDRRNACGKRYSLANILVIIFLVKMYGEHLPIGIEEWARHRR